jgi:hypothetical protein
MPQAQQDAQYANLVAQRKRTVGWTLAIAGILITAFITGTFAGSFPGDRARARTQPHLPVALPPPGHRGLEGAPGAQKRLPRNRRTSVTPSKRGTS